MMSLIRAAAAATLTLAAVVAAQAQTPPSPMPMPSAASPSPSPAASPSPSSSPSMAPENPLITARVTKEFLAWQRGRIDRTQYTPYAGGTYDPSLVAIDVPYLQAAGDPQATIYQSASLILGDLVYRYEVRAANASISVLYAIDQSGKIDGITFTPLIFRPAAAAP